MSTSPPIFTATSAYSLAFVSAVGVAAYVASKSLLPKNASWQDRVTFIWLVSSTRIARPVAPNLRASLYAYRLLTASSTTRSRARSSTTPCSASRSSRAPGLWRRCVRTPYIPTYGPQLMWALASGKEYALADSRWGTADPTVVSLEILTVFGVGTMCFYVLKQLVQRDPTRHYWIIVLSTSEIYGG